MANRSISNLVLAASASTVVALLVCGTADASAAARTGAPTVDAGPVSLITPTGWVGGNPALTSDNPMGFQGAWYTYGDSLSCHPPKLNPCEGGKCCIAGASRVDPTYKAWGCGIGLELNSSGDPTGGTHPTTKLPYSGPAIGFTVTIEGNTGGVPIRIVFTQEAFTKGVSPYVEVPGPGTYTVYLTDAQYPSWCSVNPLCPAGSALQPVDPTQVYDLQFLLAGGDKNAPFNYCITSLVAF